MKLTYKSLFLTLILIAFPTCQFGMETKKNGGSVYNNAKVIFHAIGAKFHSKELEGIDPSQSLEVMDVTLGKFIEKNPDLPHEMRSGILNMRQSMSSAKTRYLTCIDLVNLSAEPSLVHEMALQLSHDAQGLADSQSHPSILFIGGHYRYNESGSLGGHTASYEVIRQANGKLSFLVNNTVKIEKHHVFSGNRIRQLVYTDLNATDLGVIFWKNVIRTNFMNPMREPRLMDSFYSYVETKLLKVPNNGTSGRSFKCQVVGVCAWKSISVWLHGKISPGDVSENRNPSHELIYKRYKRFMFENMLANFNPGESFKATIGFEKDTNGAIFNENAALFLKAELERKIQKN